MISSNDSYSLSNNEMSHSYMQSFSQYFKFYNNVFFKRRYFWIDDGVPCRFQDSGINNNTPLKPQYSEINNSDVFINDLYDISNNKMSQPGMQFFFQYSEINNNISSTSQYFKNNNNVFPWP